MVKYLSLIFIFFGFIQAEVQPSAAEAEADSLRRLGVSLAQAGQYDSARLVFQSEVKLREELSDSARLARSLNLLAETCSDAGKNDEGLKIAHRALKIITAAAGEGDSITADSYNAIGMVYCERGDYKLALENYKKALSIRLQILGSEHLKVAVSYNNIGNVYQALGDYPQALDNMTAALAITEKKLGSEHLLTAALYNNIGIIYSHLGDCARALENYKKTLTIQLKVLGPDRLEETASYNNIGTIFCLLGSYLEGLENYNKALTIAQEFLGTEHPKVADYYYNIGSVYDDLGDYHQALEYLNKSLTCRIKSLGPEHLDVGNNYACIGDVYLNLGDYSQALENFTTSLSILLKALGPEHPAVAGKYIDIGNVYLYLGDFEKALEYYLKSLAIDLKIYGAEHLQVASIYNNIGIVYEELGEYEKALECQNRALEISLKISGPEHPDVGWFYNSIGVIAYDLRDYEQALKNYTKALAIFLETLGPEHPDVAYIYNNLGEVYDKLGEYAKALDSYNAALAIGFKSLGAEHPEMARYYLNSASTYFKMNEYGPALECAKKCLDVFEKTQKSAFYTLAEKGAMVMEKQYAPYALLTQIHMRNDNLKYAYEIWVRGRGRALYALTQRNQQAIKSDEGRELWERRANLLTRCATLYNQLETVDEVKDSQKSKNLNTLFEAARDSLEIVEKELTNKSRLYGEIFTMPAITVEQVADRLPPDATLVEYAFLEDGLYAFVVRKAQRTRGAEGAPLSVVHLLNKDELLDFKTKLGEFRASLTAAGELAGAMAEPGLTGAVKKRMEQMFGAKRQESDSLSRDLYAVLLNNIVSREPSDVMREAKSVERKALGLLHEAKGEERLIIIPDGVLNFLPFEALTDDSGRFVIEYYEVAYLNTVRELLKRSEQRVARGKVLAYGAPNYNADSIALKSGTERIAPMAEMVAMRSARGACIRDTKWEYLEGTKAEAEAIQSIFGGTVRLGNEATEVLFKQEVRNKTQKARGQSPAPKFIHLATHGYVSDCSSAMKEATLTDPMSNSGVVFAGANAGGDGYDDGFLTALEVLGLDLSGVELVTLSCCESGLGELKGSEGVFGLKRSFIAAGASSLLLSLWPVSDYWTKELMVRFYKKLNRGLSIPQALRAAKMEIMNDLKTEFGFAPPFFWSSFVLVGD